jgi:hypothetical protein
VVTLPTLLDGGASFSMRYMLSPQRTLGVASEGSTFSVVVVDGSTVVARLRTLATTVGPSFDAFIYADGSVYWTEDTLRDDGTDRIQLWAVAITADTLGKPRLVVADMGFAQLSGSAYDVIVADGVVSWAVVGGINQAGTIIRSMPLATGKTTDRVFPGSWRQTTRPWLVSATNDTVSMLNQSTGETVALPGAAGARTACSPAWCQVTVSNNGDAVRLELVRPGQAAPTRVAGPGTTFATIDPSLLGRYELLSQTGADLAPGDARLLVYDAQKATTTLIETGPAALVNVRDHYGWWLGGDPLQPVWHVLDLAALPS